jgi:hypothetical protein
MRWSIPALFVGLLAAPVVLVASPALADGPGADHCLFATATSCEFVPPSASCEASCTPGSFVAECDGQCKAEADVSCTGTCTGTCSASCTADPGMFSCSETCESDCQPHCKDLCPDGDANCDSDCNDDCSNRCQVQCDATGPSATCDAQCKASCNASCQVQVNVDCHVNCTASVELPTCSADCQSTQGALFCDGQYVDLVTVTSDCLTYLETHGVTITETCSTSSANGTNCTASLGCSASSVGTSQDRWGFLGMTGIMMGLGLAVSRRRRRA